ncbi:hypothetical protein BCR41DRAFT_345340 [Lobosporangium transversale]|uniref:Uncharacterized protein n=1 Tax=Lobosporangium transversale TaxID=64571 RepID=A0A1Y2H1K9_9FUNG|nr:hypothetical protein BCR41DRAFT_345340 [Lobosporangium transversale]ORZ28440.1 hypothetical protein BCR41DRAFT_345340 [Lobosporangium transversale]|eukprot:XP_021886125.1 hypothetical protein BCR41DRAFT_345340 [Lobosporangium transversale]
MTDVIFLLYKTQAFDFFFSFAFTLVQASASFVWLWDCTELCKVVPFNMGLSQNRVKGSQDCALFMSNKKLGRIHIRTSSYKTSFAATCSASL